MKSGPPKLHDVPKRVVAVFNPAGDFLWFSSSANTSLNWYQEVSFHLGEPLCPVIASPVSEENLIIRRARTVV